MNVNVARLKSNATGKDYLALLASRRAREKLLGKRADSAAQDFRLRGARVCGRVVAAEACWCTTSRRLIRAIHSSRRWRRRSPKRTQAR